MNETILSQRQKYILNIINQSDGLLRDEIRDQIEKLYPVSKPTLIRDLNKLVEKKAIRVNGKAKATRYYAFSRNPLLRAFDLERYFLDEPDYRKGVKNSFDFTVFDYLHDLILPNERDELKRYTGRFEDRLKQLPSDIIKRELERFVIELSWKSSKIEGNTYTLLETEALIKEQKEAVGKSHEEAVMILNHKSAFNAILRDSKSFQQINMSEINQLHGTLVKGLGISAGIRKHPVGVTGTVYRPLDNEYQIREAYEKTIDRVNKSSDPFEKALIVHVMIPYVQPYSDGNKRTARMLTNAILMAYDLYPLSYRNVNEDEFKKALILFYEQRSLYHSKRIFIEQVKFANENYFR